MMNANGEAKMFSINYDEIDRSYSEKTDFERADSIHIRPNNNLSLVET